MKRKFCEKEIPETDELQIIENEIIKTKKLIEDVTDWTTGQHILDFIDTRTAFAYGKLIGMRNILKKQEQMEASK